MKIFDCFIFNNEFDLLELRLRELYNHVDYFVLVESNLSFTCRQKPYWYENNQQRFSQWSDKIRHVKHVSSAHKNPWLNEHDQRNAITQGLVDAESEDIVLISDADEILRSSVLQKVKHKSDRTIYGFYMLDFAFKFNFVRVDPPSYEIIIMAAKASWIEKFSPQLLRDQKNNLLSLPYTKEWQKRPRTVPLMLDIQEHEVLIIQDGGWHFSYLGDDSWLYEKAKNTSHQEDITEEFLAQLDVKKSIKEKKFWDRSWPYRYEIVDFNSYFPQSCNLFPHYILPDSGISVQEILSNYAT